MSFFFLLYHHIITTTYLTPDQSILTLQRRHPGNSPFWPSPTDRPFTAIQHIRPHHSHFHPPPSSHYSSSTTAIATAVPLPRHLDSGAIYGNPPPTAPPIAARGVAAPAHGVVPHCLVRCPFLAMPVPGDLRISTPDMGVRCEMCSLFALLGGKYSQGRVGATADLGMMRTMN
jgi:hypothetical protein